MTDKEKLNRVIAEIKRLIADYNIKVEKYRGMNEQAHQYYGGKRDALSEILKPIDSMQKEPVSEELEKEIQDYYNSRREYSGRHNAVIPVYKHQLIDIARHFANWQKEQFKKNRLKHCDSITNEQEELEQKFLDQHLDKNNRMPTFLDAIEYGMRLQKKIMEVWHDGNEEPKDKSKVILFQVGDKTKTVWTMEYHKEDKKFHVTSPLGNDYVVGLDCPNIRWAYPGDILPNK